jgi:hypothetical protein
MAAETTPKVQSDDCRALVQYAGPHWTVNEVMAAAAGVKASIILRRKTNEPDAEASAALLMLTARDLGLPPVAAIPQMHVIEGNVTVSPHLMLALIQRSGLGTVLISEGPGWCKVRMARHDGTTEHEVAWDMDRAKAAGLAGKSNWKNHQPNMLRARAIGECARIVFADVIYGLYTPQDFDHTEETAEEAPWEPRVVEDTSAPVDRIGQEGVQRIFAACKAAARQIGCDEKELVEEVKRRRKEIGKENVADFTREEGDAIAMWLAQRIEQARTVDGEFEPDDTPDSAAPTAAELFPEGGMTPVTRWREVCDEHGLGLEEQKALQERAFGAVRPPESPDDMAALVAATLEEIV